MNTTNYDSALGIVLRRKRAQAGLSQSQVANSIGISYQQIQKYEVGSNRVIFSRLMQLADVLSTTPEQIIAEVREVMGEHAGERPEPDAHETLQVVGLAKAIPEPARASIIALMRSIAKAETDETGS